MSSLSGLGSALRRVPPAANPGLTHHGYTSHQHHNTGDGDIGLIYMNARYYLPGLARFASPDTLIPDPTNLQALNRYTYTLNNPLVFTDPTGHYACHTNGICADAITASQSFVRPFTSPFIQFTGTGWTTQEKQLAHQAARAIANRMAQTLYTQRRDLTLMEGEAYVRPLPTDVFLAILDGPIQMHKYSDRSCTVATDCRAWVGSTTVYIGMSGFTNHHLILHEIFHVLDIGILNGAANQALLEAQRADPDFPDRSNLTEANYNTWGGRWWQLQ